MSFFEFTTAKPSTPEQKRAKTLENISKNNQVLAKLNNQWPLRTRWSFHTVKATSESWQSPAIAT